MSTRESCKSDAGEASLYAIRSVLRACEILKCFKGEQGLGLDVSFAADAGQRPDAAECEARRELRKDASRLVGAVAFFPERYGGKAISLAMDKVMGKRTPSATFVKHQLVSREHVDALYPNDSHILHGDSDSLLWSLH